MISSTVVRVVKSPIQRAMAFRRTIQRAAQFRRMNKIYGDTVIDAQGALRNRRPGETLRELQGGDGNDHSANIRALREAVGRDRKIWDRIQLSFREQTYERQKPVRFFKLQIELLKHIGGRTVVEIGSARARLRHPIEGFNPVCCNDGHSTYHWASNPTFDVHTVDISPASKRVLDGAGLPNLKAYTTDGIGFLRDWNGPSIDLLFLDAWDVGVPQYAEKPLEAYEAAKTKLSPRHIVGIDDTDFAADGKGKLLVPHLKSLGYKLVAEGRQTIFVNFEVS